MSYKPFQLPESFLLGTATAPVQIEGGDKNHNWHRWCDKKKIDDKSHCFTACDHWNRVEEDVQLMNNIHSDTYRMGIEWSRIFPKRGQLNEENLAHYKNEISLLNASGIKPLVTLWHFSHPLWIEFQGGWLSRRTIIDYLEYISFIVNEFKDIVTDWVTFNEPNVYLTFGYFEGKWSPGKKGKVASYLKAAKHMIIAHQEAYDIIKSIQANSQVGVAHHLRVFQPVTKGFLSRKGAQLQRHLFQEIFMDPMTTGEWRSPLRNKLTVQRNYVDFFGLNYYTRDIVHGTWRPDKLFGNRRVPADAPVNDLDWEIYPEGLYQLCMELKARYDMPIWITENGTCDHKDIFRSSFIYDHLYQIDRAIKKGADVQRYYHWSLMDNFEWTEGYVPRFGLYHVNYNTQKRTLRTSGQFYADICKNKGVTEQAIETYLS